MKDTEQLLTLYNRCFPQDPDDFWHWIFDRVWRPENTLYIRDSGIVVASLQMIPCALRLHDRLYKAHYIYGAATLPEYRGRGLMGSLLRQAEQEGRRRGQDFSLLITQEDSLLDYYARFDYAPRLICGRGADGDPAPEGQTCPMSISDLPAVDAIYRRCTAGLLCGHRDDPFWKLQMDLFGRGAWVLRQNGLVTAYAFCDERGVLEAAGPGAAALCACISPGRPWRTIPQGEGIPMGSIKPLNEKARALMEQNPCFLNLMFN